jgi:tetratricopeptide (TPR) repeat protein
VRYVLTGRLQAVAEEQRDLVMKVTLIDTATGNYVGEFTFELEAKQTRGLFFHDLGDRIFRAVLTSLDIEPGERLLQHALRRDIGRFGILNFIHDAEVTWSEFSEESNNRVIAEAKTRIKRRPQEVALHVLLAWGQWAKLANGWTHGLAGGYKRMADPAKRALEISPDYPPARSLQAVVNIWGGKTENAVTSCQEAKSLGPSDAHVAFDCGLVYLLAGQYEDALAETERGLRLHPDPPVFRRDVLAEIYRVSGRGEDMRRIDEQIIAGKTRPWQTVPAHLRLLVTEADAGNVEAARKRLARIREIAPETSLDIYRGRFRYRDPKVMAKFYATLDAVQNEP